MTIPTTTQSPLLLGCGDIIVIIWGFYFLTHYEIWLFKFEPLNVKAFYLTSSELVILQLLGKSTVACSTIIPVYPEGLGSIFILPVWTLTGTLTTKWILLCYPGKSSHLERIAGRGITHLEKWIESLRSRLCYWPHKQPQANHLN